jgi:hypothetical protein
VHEAVALSPNTEEAKHGVWWLQNHSLKDGDTADFTRHVDMLPYPAPPVQPTAKAYYAPGTGAFFARSSWATTASWFHTVAGKFDQSHAHHDQGSFSFYKNTWLSVTSNIWSHSGIQQLDGVHNVIRFAKVSDGSTIAQNMDDTHPSSLTFTETANGATVTASLTNAFSAHHTQVVSWTRTFTLNGDTLGIHDVCAVGAGIKPIFQLHVPVQPVLQGDGSITAGTLTIVPLLPVQSNWVAMHSVDSDFNSGWRIELTTASGCEFNVELRAH